MSIPYRAPSLLCETILALAPLHRATANASGSWDELQRTRHAKVREVWSGGCDHTIYPTPAINHAFRAWHDACHLEGHYNFSLEGERATCALQCGQLRMALCEYNSAMVEYFCTVLDAEIIGQALYYERHGLFPLDQAAFVGAYLEDATTALLMEF